MRFVFVLLLMTLAGSARAEWVKYLEGGKLGMRSTSYYDPTTIKRLGDLVRVWVYAENSVPVRREGDQLAQWSSRTQYEINCKNQQWRPLRGTVYSGPMMSGEIFSETGLGEWADISGSTLLKVACK